MTARKWGARRGRGGARANSGGKRAGAGRPKTDDVGYVPMSVRLGPEQVASAQQLASELGVPVAEVYRRALHGHVRLGAATEPYVRDQPLAVTPETLIRIQRRAQGGDVALVVRGILSGDIDHL